MKWLALLALSGCAFIGQAHVRKFDRQVVAYEQLTPDAEALKRGDTRTTFDKLKEMDDWIGYIGEQDLPPIDRQKLVDRLHRAYRTYMLAAAQLTDTPDLGYWLARQVLVEGDAEALEIVRTLSDARAVRRQKQFATNHTYSYVKQGEMEIETTSSGMSVENGQVSESVSSSLVVKPGNCVLATRPFGPEGTANPGLTFRIVGNEPVIHVRCYLSQDLAALPTWDGEVVASVPMAFSNYEIHLGRPHGNSQRMFDFVMKRGNTGFLDSRHAFDALSVSLDYVFTNGHVLAWDSDGHLVIAKDQRVYHLAESPWFWDRDGTLPATVAAGQDHQEPAAPRTRPKPVASRRSSHPSR